MKKIAALIVLGFGLGGLAYWLYPPTPPVAVARPKLIGVVSLTVIDRATLAGFKVGLTELGYPEGEAVRYFNPGPAVKIEQLDTQVATLLRQKPDLILVSSTPATLAVQRATQGSGVPVVFGPVTDPLNTGIVASLSRPGGNITGVRLSMSEDRRLQWLLEIAPATRHVYVPYQPDDKSALVTLSYIRAAANRLGVELILQAVRNSVDIQSALAQLPDTVDAMFLLRDSTIESHIQEFVAVSLQRKLPLSAPSFLQVEPGALFSYGFMHEKIGGQAARLAVQIFNGSPPATLPVETAESYLFLNLRTAAAIGLDIPDAILRQAERIIR